MLTRDTYIAILEKRAASEEVDNQEAALQDYAHNSQDNREYLKGLFNEASSTEKEQSKQVHKLFPGKEDKESGHVFLKVARAAFYDAVRETDLVKTASPAYLETAFRSFCRELEKVAAIKPTTLNQLSARNAVAQNFQKTWDLTGAAKNPATVGSAAYAKLPIEKRLAISRQAKAGKPGLLSRLLGRK